MQIVKQKETTIIISGDYMLIANSDEDVHFSNITAFEDAEKCVKKVKDLTAAEAALIVAAYFHTSKNTK